MTGAPDADDDAVASYRHRGNAKSAFRHAGEPVRHAGDQPALDAAVHDVTARALARCDTWRRLQLEWANAAADGLKLRWTHATDGLGRRRAHAADAQSQRVRLGQHGGAVGQGR